MIIFHRLWNDPESFRYFCRDFFLQIFLETTLLTKGKNKGLVVGFHGLHNEQGSKINIVVALSPCNFIKTSFVAPERITVLLQLLWERKQQWLFFFAMRHLSLPENEDKFLRKITRISLVVSEIKIWKNGSPKHETFNMKYAEGDFQKKMGSNVVHSLESNILGWKQTSFGIYELVLRRNGMSSGPNAL